MAAKRRKRHKNQGKDHFANIGAIHTTPVKPARQPLPLFAPFALFRGHSCLGGLSRAVFQSQRPPSDQNVR
jgi:hypothetical protein